MKTLCLSIVAFAAIATASSLAQNARPPGPRPVAPATIDAGGGEAVAEAARFDLKFPGGKVKDFVAAVSKAVGKPVNVIVPKEGEGTQIPAVEVSRVTVPTLFSALSNASQHDVAVPVSTQFGTSTEYKTAGFNFRTEEPFAADAVWTFLVLNPAELPAAEPADHPSRQVQYFPVAQYLTHFSVEDITTAIETGWKLQGGPAEPPPTIRFHEETQLLITAGTAAQMELVPQVLQGLSPMLQYPRAENLPITRKARQIIVPKLEFREATVMEAVEFIRAKAVGIDPEHRGFNIVVNTGAGELGKVTLSLSETPAMDALKLIAELGGMELEVRDYAIVFLPPGAFAARTATPAAGNPAMWPGSPPVGR